MLSISPNQGNDDDASSIYSRSPDSPKISSTEPVISLETGYSPYDRPEINCLDHQIALAQGSTIALETTRTRLQDAKSTRPLSFEGLWKEKLQLLDLQLNENTFYHACLENLNGLIGVARDVSQTLQHYSEQNASPAGNPHVLHAALTLRDALEQSRTWEAQAEHKWKQFWNLPRIWNPSTRWI